MASDLTYSGLITNDIQAGEDVTFGNILYMKSDGKLYDADATASVSSLVFGMAVSGSSADAYPIILRSGYVRDESWDWTVGVALYLAKASGSYNSGSMTETATTGSGDQLNMLGIAYSTSSVQFNPSNVLAETLET